MHVRIVKNKRNFTYLKCSICGKSAKQGDQILYHNGTGSRLLIHRDCMDLLLDEADQTFPGPNGVVHGISPAKLRRQEREEREELEFQRIRSEAIAAGGTSITLF